MPPLASATTVASGEHSSPLLTGTGEMATRIRMHDWASTPLGPLSEWSEALLTTVNLMLGSSFPMSLYWGDQWTLIYNDAYHPFLTDKHPQALGRTARQVWARSWEILKADFDTVYKLGRVTQGENVLIPLESHGEMRDQYWTFSRSPVYDGQKIAGIFSISHSTTDAVLSRRALAMSEERLRLALAASRGVGTWDWDVPNDLVYSDSNFAATYGVDPIRAAAGTPIAEFTAHIHPDDLERVGIAIDRALQTGEDFAEEYRITSADGSVRWLATQGRCLLSPEGKPVRFPGVAVDITERKLTESALLQSEKLAAVGRLASSIAHEINNPLESVTNLIYLARTSEELSTVQEFLDLAERELRRASAITNQTLRFHKQTTSPRAVTSDDLLSDAISLYQGRILNSNVELEKRKRATQPVTRFDGEIRQVLANLIGNAIDALHEQRGGRLLLRSRDATDWATGRRGLLITIADNAGGISPETQRRLFEPFFTTKGINGNGLGLWISQEIIARHNGALRLRSSQRPGHTGSVFTLFLPYDTTPRT